MAEQTIRPPWFDPSVPKRHDVVLRDLLDRRAADHPEREFVVFEGGESWSYRDCRKHARRTASALKSLGIVKGDRVAVWAPTGRDILRLWFGACYLGAIFVPLNTAYRGGILEHTLNNCRATVLAGHRQLLPLLKEIETPNLRHVIVLAGDVDLRLDATLHPCDILDQPEDGLADLDRVDIWDAFGIIYTSGTTGPSKGVLSPYLQLHTNVAVNYGFVREDDRMLVHMPMCHISGIAPVFATLVFGMTVVLYETVRTEFFWHVMNKHECTMVGGLIGALGSFLARTEPSENDRDNRLRMLSMFPINEETVSLGPRFGFDYFTGFNMSEISLPLISDTNSTVYGGCGRPRTGVECRIVDDNDIDVPAGEVGELILRSDRPWDMFLAYDGMGEATAAAWRNGWFHTGDGFRMNDAGEFFFVDRLKDTIRRRGENISSAEVEAEVSSHPQVEDSVAVAVPGEHGEDEVLVVIVPCKDQVIDPLELIHYLTPRMAHFMVPRFVRIVDAIARTETGKVRKNVLRDEGITADAWDREQAGVIIARNRLSVRRQPT